MLPKGEWRREVSGLSPQPAAGDRPWAEIRGEQVAPPYQCVLELKTGKKREEQVWHKANLEKAGSPHQRGFLPETPWALHLLPLRPQ